MLTSIVGLTSELIEQLQELGKQRGGKFVCLVIVTPTHIEFVYPGILSADAIDDAELGMLNALVQIRYEAR